MISSRPTIPAERYRDRLSAARTVAGEAGFAAVLVGVGADMRYLAGYPAMPLERLTMLVIPAHGSPTLIAPRLEATPARSCPPAAAGDLPVATWEEGEDAYALVAGMVGGGGRQPRSGLRSPTTSPRVTCCRSRRVSRMRPSSWPRRSSVVSGSSRTPTSSRS